VSNTIFIFGVLVVFFVSPLFYGLIESLVRSDTFLKNIPFMKKNLNMSVNLLNLLLILIISGITIILLIHGLVSSDGTAIAISIFIPFCALISYVGITFFRNSTTENSEQFVIPPRNPILRGEEHSL
jgi:ABC-type polysaccharide/polyol phosphate export permease